MFRRFSCGCLGVSLHWDRPPGHPDRKVMCLRACDGEGDLAFGLRPDLLTQGSRKLDDEEIEQLLDEAGVLIDAGHRFNQLKTLLGGH